jgi:hypothetical protein
MGRSQFLGGVAAEVTARPVHLPHFETRSGSCLVVEPIAKSRRVGPPVAVRRIARFGPTTPKQDDPAVPADHNGTERDIRSLAAARSDGGTHRADWCPAAFARLKSVIVTGMKNQVRFIKSGIEVVRAKLRGERLPLPLAAAPDAS